MLNLRYGSRFKKEFRNALKQKGQTLEKFKAVMEYLINEMPLPPEYQDLLLRTGSHSDLFK